MEEATVIVVRRVPSLWITGIGGVDRSAGERFVPPALGPLGLRRQLCARNKANVPTWLGHTGCTRGLRDRLRTGLGTRFSPFEIEI